MLRLLDIGVPRTGTVYREQTLKHGPTGMVHKREHYNFSGMDKVDATTKIGEVVCPTFSMHDLNDPFYRHSFIYFVYRNPLDLLVSHWAFLKRQDVQVHHFDADLSGVGFPEYFNIVINRQNKYPNEEMLYWQCFDECGNFIPSAVIMYEQMEAGLQQLADLTDCQYTSGEVFNSSVRTDYGQYYTSEMMEMAKEVYVKDFTLLDDHNVIQLPRRTL